ncbi:MAG: hypothetical protein LAO04_19300 [Acidobacteriia bacterium]|nr:hypothetical protein [Terriglobia bacterium]
MPSSTFNFEAEAAEACWAGREDAIERKHLVWLLATLALTCVSLEIGVTWWSREISNYGRRIDSQYAEAIRLQPGGSSEPSSVLLVGNSSLRYGIDIQGLRKRVEPHMNVHVLSIDATLYEDWYFGLKGLFRKGSRPDRVVLILSPGQMAHVLPPTDDAARYLLGPGDILTRVRMNQLGPTTLSNSLCAHWSAFFGRRNDLRLGIKRALFPGFETMARRYMVRDTSPNYDLLPARLRELEALCSHYVVSCSCVMPPTNQMNDTLAAPSVLEAAAEAGIPVALPVPNSQLSNDKYVDGYHLNPMGQEIFTAAVADFLTRQQP